MRTCLWVSKDHGRGAFAYWLSGTVLVVARPVPGVPQKAPPKRGSITMVQHQVEGYAILSSTQISSYGKPAPKPKAELPWKF